MLFSMDDIVNRKSKYYGKLTPECLKDLDALLIRMRLINRKNARKKVIRMSDIVSLPDGDYIRLWGYIRHCCQLATSWPNVRKSISVVAEKSGREFHDVMAECIDSMTIHVYTYAWRHYRHSEECGYVFSTAEYGYKSWITSQNSYMMGEIAAAKIEEEKGYSGKRVTAIGMS